VTMKNTRKPKKDAKKKAPNNLKEMKCPKCNYSFKVADLENFVCPNCYFKQIPKYRSKKKSREKNPYVP
jgi:protein-arginine kinase activator protein McsA